MNRRWQRFDPELADATVPVPDPSDMAWGAAPDNGFVSAANAWLAYRKDDIDPDTFGVDHDVPVLRGPRFLFNEVIIEAAHRCGDELLLWDGWGRMGEPGTSVEEERPGGSTRLQRYSRPRTTVTPLPSRYCFTDTFLTPGSIQAT